MKDATALTPYISFYSKENVLFVLHDVYLSLGIIVQVTTEAKVLSEKLLTSMTIFFV